MPHGDRSWNAKKGNRMERRVKQEVVTPEVPEVDDRHVYRFHEALEWANTIRVIREKFALRRDGPHLDIICRNEAGNDVNDDIILHFKMRDVYLLGFTLGDVVYEFSGAVHELPGSIFLGYKPGYGDMGAASTMSNIKIGYCSFYQTLIEMINGTGLVGQPRQKWMKRIQNRIPTVLVMLPECVRFKWHYVVVKQMMLTANLNQGGPQTVNDWMELGIKNWETASVVAFEKEHDYPHPPPGENYAYRVSDMEIALKYWAWATDLLVVHCLVERKPLHALKSERRSDGKRNVPHVLVRWNNKEEDWQPVSRMKRDFPSFDTRVSRGS